MVDAAPRRPADTPSRDRASHPLLAGADRFRAHGLPCGHPLRRRGLPGTALREAAGRVAGSHRCTGVLAKYGPLPDAAGLAKLPLLHGTEIDWANWCAGDTSCLKALPGAY